MKPIHVTRHPLGQRGIVLVSALLLLVVMTILAMIMFRTNGVQELIAGNIREKQRALISAEAAEEYAEIWLATGGNALNTAYCATFTLVPYSSTSLPPVCGPTQALATIDDKANVTTLPWTVGGKEVGATFFPGSQTGSGDMILSATGGPNAYYQAPRFYVQYVGTFGLNQALFMIDAWNWAGTQNTAAEVESSYVVTANVSNAGGP